MSMRCDVCDVSLNSSTQYQQHVTGQSHAKKVRLYEEGKLQPRSQHQGQGGQQSQGQGQKQSPGRGRGRAIRGAGGRGRGSSFGQGGAGRGGYNSNMNFGQNNAGQSRMQFFGQPSSSSNSDMQSGMTFPSTLPGLEPLVMNALNLTAAALQSTASSNMGFGRGNPQNSSGNYQLFGNNQASGTGNQPFSSGSGPTFGSVSNFGSGQNFSSSQAFGSGQSFASSQGFTGGQGFGNSQGLGGFGSGQNMGSGQSFGNSQSLRNSQGFANNQGFGNKNFYGSQPNWRALKAQKPKQPPPPPKPKPEPVDLKEPLVFEDHMGVVSVSMEGENQLYCDICCVHMTSPDQALFHYRGAKHRKKARVARLHEVGALSEDMDEASNGEFYCSYCNVTVNSREQMNVHKEGQRHRKMVEQRKRKSGDTMDMEPSEKKSMSPATSADYSQSFVPGGGL